MPVFFYCGISIHCQVVVVVALTMNEKMPKCPVGEWFHQFFQPLEVVCRGSETQLQVGENGFNPCAAGNVYIRFQAYIRSIEITLNLIK